MFGGDSINHLSLSDPHSEEESKPSRKTFSIVRLISKRRRSDHERAFGHLEDRFIRIALRVSLYPLAMIIVNTLIAAGDLFITVNGVTTTPAYALYCVYYWFYGGRGMVFCCLALFVDPCLSKGVYAAWRAKHPTTHDTHPAEAKEPWGSEFAAPGVGPVNTIDNAPVATVLDSFGGDGVAAPQNSLQRQESGGSLDFMQALFASEPPHVIEEQRRLEAKAVRDAARAARRQSRRSSVVTFWRRGSRDVETPPIPPSPSQPPPLSLPQQSPPIESPGGMEFAGVDAAFLPAEFADLTDVVAPETLAAAAEEERERREKEEREAAERAAAAAAEERAKELDRISEHSGASTPNLVTTLAYMARGRRASKVSHAAESIGSGARSPNQGHGSPAFASYRSSAAPEWTSGYGASRQSRTSADGPRTPADGRSRRQKALEIAEKLYEEMEQQL